MAGDPKMKVEITSETSGFVKGAKEVRQQLKDLDKVGNSALSGIGSMFGVNVQKIQQMSSAMAGLGQKLQKTGSEGTAAFGKMLTSISGVSAAIAGLGLGAAISSFKILKEYADGFRNTIEGANLALQTEAYLSAFKDTMRDVNSAIGRSSAEAIDNTTKGWKVAWETIKSAIANGIMNPSGQGLGGNIIGALPGAIAGVAAGEQAAEIQGRINQLSQEQVQSITTIAELNKDIAELKEKARDEEVSLSERQEAVRQLQEKINQKYDLQVSLQQRAADLLIEMNSLTENSLEDTKKEQEALAQVTNLEAQRAAEITSTFRLQKSISTEINKQNEEYRKQQDEIARINAIRGGALMTTNVSAGVARLNGKAVSTTIDVIPQLDTQAVDLMIIEFAQLVSSGVESIAESMGTLMGDVLTGGEDAWQNFANSAISAFGDMAIAVGKMAIETGTATLGIKAALESLNGYVAIAAGAALVALGYAVKQGMSNIASGNYSSATSGYVANGSYGNRRSDTYASQALQIELTGQFTASGTALTTVLSNENIKKRHTS